jgi:hypothetical protein
MDMMKRHLGVSIVILSCLFSIAATKTHKEAMSNPHTREELQNRVDGKLIRAESFQKRGKQCCGNKGGFGIDGYYKSVIDNNLFRPLGWVRKTKKRGPEYRLIGIIITENKKPKALIFENAKKTTHCVSMGDKIGNTTVKSIDERSITLKQDSQQTLKLNIMQASTFLGSSADDKGDSNSPRGKCKRRWQAARTLE